MSSGKPFGLYVLKKKFVLGKRLVIDVTLNMLTSAIKSYLFFITVLYTFTDNIEIDLLAK